MLPIVLLVVLLTAPASAEPERAVHIYVSANDFTLNGSSYATTEHLSQAMAKLSGRYFAIVLYPCASKVLVSELSEYLRIHNERNGNGGLRMYGGALEQQDEACPNA